MINKLLLVVTCVVPILFGYNAMAQVQIYNPNADAIKDLNQAIERADVQGKHVLVQVGGNWCPWCVKLNKIFTTDSTIMKVLNANYVLVKVNYSKENKNEAVLEKLEFPQRFGFPVLVILDDHGKRIHTQDSGLLESGDGYDTKKIVSFLKNWTKAAIGKPEKKTPTLSGSFILHIV